MPSSSRFATGPVLMIADGFPRSCALIVEFTLAGQRFLALNGGERVEYTYALSLEVNCEDQAEIDRLWDAAVTSGGGAPVQSSPR